ncbi:hypothetical protein Tco_0827827 [Tanacetum coccineum]
MMKNDEKLCNDDLLIWWLLKIKFKTLASFVAPCRTAVVRTRDHEDHHDDDARPEGESSAKRQKTSKYDTYSIGESLSKQVDDFRTDDDEVPTEEVLPKLMEEISREINEA